MLNSWTHEWSWLDFRKQHSKLTEQEAKAKFLLEQQKYEADMHTLYMQSINGPAGGGAASGAPGYLFESDFSDAKVVEFYAGEPYRWRTTLGPVSPLDLNVAISDGWQSTPDNVGIGGDPTPALAIIIPEGSDTNFNQNLQRASLSQGYWLSENFGLNSYADLYMSFDYYIDVFNTDATIYNLSILRFAEGAISPNANATLLPARGEWATVKLKVSSLSSVPPTATQKAMNFSFAMYGTYSSPKWRAGDIVAVKDWKFDYNPIT